MDTFFQACAICGHGLQLPVHLDGKTGKCPKCNNTISISISEFGNRELQLEPLVNTVPPPLNLPTPVNAIANGTSPTLSPVIKVNSHAIDKYPNLTRFLRIHRIVTMIVTVISLVGAVVVTGMGIFSFAYIRNAEDILIPLGILLLGVPILLFLIWLNHIFMMAAIEFVEVFIDTERNTRQLLRTP